MFTLKDFKDRGEAIERRGREISDSLRGLFYLTEVAAVAADNLIKENNNGTKNAISRFEPSKLKRKRSPRTQRGTFMTEFKFSDAGERSKTTPAATSHGNKKERVKLQKGRASGAYPPPDMPQRKRSPRTQLGASMPKTEFNVRDARKRSMTTPAATSHGNKKERVKRHKGRASGANPPPDMPQEFKTRIKEMAGDTEVELIIQKPLFETDLKKGEGRMSIPANQIQCHNFLTDEEEQSLNMLDERGKLKAIETKVIGPNVTEETTNMNFKKWNMKKSDGSCSSSYVLTTKWNSLVARNPSTLKVGNTIQLWSFRQEGQLCFALVALGPAGGADGGDS